MHMAVFLPVPPHQLFPSGGLKYLHTLWAAVFRRPFFLAADNAFSDPLAAPESLPNLRAGGRGSREERRAMRKEDRSQIGPPVAARAQPRPRHPGRSSFARRYAPRSSVAAGMLARSCTGRAALPSRKCLRKKEGVMKDRQRPPPHPYEGEISCISSRSTRAS